MTKDEFIVWMEQSDHEELVERYLEKKGLTDDFMTWCFEVYQEEQRAYDDYVYEQEKDRREGL